MTTLFSLGAYGWSLVRNQTDPKVTTVKVVTGYVETRRSWRLYCQHRDLRWHAYQSLPAAARFETLLDEVAADPTGIFWG